MRFRAKKAMEILRQNAFVTSPRYNLDSDKAC